MKTTVKLTLDGLIEALRLKSVDLARGSQTSRGATREGRTGRVATRRTEDNLPEGDDELRSD